jgi:hypothetical protein
MRMAATIAQARKVKEKVMALIAANLSLKNALTGIGISTIDSGYGVKVNFANEVADQRKLPGTLDGVPLVITIVGRVSKQ